MNGSVKTPSAEEQSAREKIRAVLEPARFDLLERFVGALDQWGAVSNLVSAADRERIWARHIADSLQVVALAEGRGRRWIDLGAGAGFPGLVVAIARPETVMTLVESNRKKAAFLLRVVADCGLDAKVEPHRAEALAADTYDVVSARALAPLHKLLALSEPFFGPDTLGLFPKGRDAGTEIEAVSDHRFDVTAHPSQTDPDGAVLAVTNLVRV
ncbi:16S rRNA (guanine(527)-N(7))-methyltransferase RsmG [Acuticoccus sp. MNP-M23]|uniref:16S rRNA (guanine(527)-N(7))-methyltransferase RsmG n=1 Tax=Acuticoccus sp. MNP-M23 TaxID=3072793 RepID=UPI002814B116|nr:16S rRNA (guanine(527)-N(7))-methyltransferase RsmG [Acuticoccus sp. MNP-M23]WMS44285.1 16S rRNA (guanine(527)-N(7))-methyltransferase RsmG [Acuticoccus sp. MNP-M23]